MISEERISHIQNKARDIRISIIQMLAEAKSGHTGGPLGLADIYATLYFHSMTHDAKNPFMQERDRLILSNGHVCPVLYASMAHAGYFPVDTLMTLRKFGSSLQGHPHRDFLPALETSSGPLGSGLSQAIGMALSDAREFGSAYPRYMYCMTGDGELNEGQVWEAILMAPKEKLGNIIMIVDRNYIQIDGNTEDVMPLDPLDKKFEAFNWHVQTVDGHSIKDIAEAIDAAKKETEKPSVIIARTIPGKGVSFMEHRYEWHGVPPGIADVAGAPKKEEQVEVALSELRAHI